MDEQQHAPKLFTADEANALLPDVRLLLQELRTSLRHIMTAEAQVESEEIVAADEQGQVSDQARMRIDDLMASLNNHVDVFHETLARLESLGCLLKDLDAGLVDFHTLMNGEVVYLCWREEEPRVAWWHPIETGFAGRQPLDS